MHYTSILIRGFFLSRKHTHARSHTQMTAHGEEFFGFDARIGSVLKTIISPWVWCTTKSSCYGKQIDYVQKSQLQSSESLLVLFSMQHLQSRQGITDEKSLGVSFGKERHALTIN